MSEINLRITIGHLHPIGSVGERLDDQVLSIVSPFAHPRVRADDKSNIDVLLLPGLVVK